MITKLEDGRILRFAAPQESDPTGPDTDSKQARSKRKPWQKNALTQKMSAKTDLDPFTQEIERQRQLLKGHPERLKSIDKLEKRRKPHLDFKKKEAK